MTATPTSDPPTTRKILFEGRELDVAMPGAEQLAVWQRTAKRMAGYDPNSGDGPEAMKLLDRGMRVIESVLPGQDDRDWLEDQLLDGNLTLEKAAAIVTQTVEAFRDQPANGKARPVKKAARRAAR